LKILQIVTLVSGVGAFGGPTRVAVNQCDALTARGHQTLLVGGADRLPLGTTVVDNVPTRLFRVRRLVKSKPMAYLWSPTMLWWLWRHATQFDVIHVHLARDGVTLPAALIARRHHIPFVVQTHGMVNARAGLVQRIVDRLATLRVLNGAGRVYALSDAEVGQLRVLVPQRSSIDVLPNGVGSLEAGPRPSALGTPEFLFLARLHPRKRAPLFVTAAMSLLDRGCDASFTLVGPDEGDGPAVEAAIADYSARKGAASTALRWTGPIAPEQTSERLRRAFAYVLPSVDEPFPMSVIEALAVGVPVIVTESNGLAGAIEEYECGLVVAEDSVEALTDAMQRLLSDAALAEQMGRRAFVAARERFSIDSVADTLLRDYQDASSPNAHP
jgi:glycosyltransferase involved in cell wall biosynthesis